jgi:hypothetical protein
MNKSTIERVVPIALMPGVTDVQLRTVDNQIWLTVTGHEETKAVVAALEDNFATEANKSDAKCWKEDNMLYYSIYPKDLIISITGYQKELSADTEGEENSQELEEEK